MSASCPCKANFKSCGYSRRAKVTGWAHHTSDVLSCSSKCALQVKQRRQLPDRVVKIRSAKVLQIVNPHLSLNFSSNSYSTFHGCQEHYPPVPRFLCRLTKFGHFSKRYSKQKRINLTFESRWHVLHFLLVAGLQLNAVVLQGSTRFAQGFDCSARQMPETGEKMILANQWQNRARASRKLICKLGLPEPPRAHAPPHVLFDYQRYSTLSYSSLGSYFSFLFFSFLRQFNLMYLQLKSAPRKRH